MINENKKLEISRMLTISTAHITNETRHMLKAEPEENVMCLSIYEKAGFGWFVAIPSQWNNSNEWNSKTKDSIPKDLKACIDLAAENGCAWLCLDCDGSETTHLDNYSNEKTKDNRRK